jgi:hypothetical protein
MTDYFQPNFSILYYCETEDMYVEVYLEDCLRMWASDGIHVPREKAEELLRMAWKRVKGNG